MENPKKTIELIVSIGEPIYYPYRYEEADGTIVMGVESGHLSGYINENGREWYAIYEDGCDADIPIEDAFATADEAAAELARRWGPV